MTTVFAFSVFAFLASVTPGPANLAILAASSRSGARSAGSFVMGILCGFALVLAVVCVLHTVGMEFADSVRRAIEIVGAIYLIYLGYCVWRSPAPHDVGKEVRFRSGLPIHPLSSKAWIFVITSYVTFATGKDWKTNILYAVVFLGAAVIAHLSWLLLGEFSHRKLKDHSLILLNRSAAVVMIAMVVVSVATTFLPTN